MKRTAWVLVAIAIVLLAIAGARRCGDDARAPIRFATFNIENFPKDARQVAGAFDQIAALAASFVAVQEISEPALFAREAERRLGPTWEFVHLDTAPWGHGRATLPWTRSLGKSHHNGVVFDTRVWTLVSWRSHHETRLGERHKPTLEVRLRPVRGGAIVRVLVVHLKSGGGNADLRERQLHGLRTIAGKSDEPTILLGDFNATGDHDRQNLAALARETGLHWTSRDLACSAFWSRDDGCPRSRLDHVLMSRRAARVEAAGACATHGCDWGESCPIYAEHVSDHCPVVVTLD